MKLALLFLMAIVCVIMFGVTCVAAAAYTSKYMVYENTQNGISAAASFSLSLGFALLFIDTVRDINKC